LPVSDRKAGSRPDDYDHPVCTGDNMDRPILKRLLADIEAGRIGIMLVYKIDRLTRSLSDFLFDLAVDPQASWDEQRARIGL
jgi:hypothetical protein